MSEEDRSLRVDVCAIATNARSVGKAKVADSLVVIDVNGDKRTYWEGKRFQVRFDKGRLFTSADEELFNFGSRNNPKFAEGKLTTVKRYRAGKRRVKYDPNADTISFL